MNGETQPLPERAPELKPAEPELHFEGLAGASPFLNRKITRDPTRIVILVTVAAALLVFLGSMLAVLMMHAPT